MLFISLQELLWIAVFMKGVPGGIHEFIWVDGSFILYVVYCNSLIIYKLTLR